MTKDRLLLKAITEIQSLWVRQRDSKELFQCLLSNLLALTESEYGFVGEVSFNKAQPCLKTRASSNISWDQASFDFYRQHAGSGMELYQLKSLYGEVMTTGKPVIANAPATDHRRSGLPEGHPKMSAFMGLPLSHNGEILGMVGVADRNGGYDEELIEYLQPFLSTCSNILLSQQLRLAHKNAEATLRGREKLLLEIMERIPIGVFVINPEGTPCYMNRMASHVVGIECGDNFTLSRLPEHCQVYQEGTDQLYRSENLPIVRALNGETATASDMEIRQGGTRMSIQATASPIHDETGKITYAVATFHDISELKQQQARVNEEEALHRAILDSSIDAIITIDERGIIQRINPATEKMFGYSRGEMIGENVKILMPEPHANRHDDYIHNYLQTGQSKIIGIGREVEAQCKDGSLVPCDLVITEVKLPGRRFFKGILRDITERKRIDRMKKEFISTVSHELRTPLTSIRGSFELLLGGVSGEMNPLAKELLEIAGNNVDRLIMLVNDILDMEKLESGALKFDLVPQSLLPLVEQAVSINQTFALQHGTSFQINSGLTDILAVIDKSRFIQVLTNLLSNAAKFSFAGRPVTISMDRFDETIRVTVADEGPGIPDSFKGSLFKRFSQLDQADSQRKGGTGLGLCISKVLIERMGGRIGFHSKVGSGSCFYVEVPIYHPPAREEKKQLATTVPHVAVGQRILICEDDPDIAKLLEIMLTKRGFETDIAKSWIDAYSFLSTRDYAAMTLDLMLPDQHWIDIFRQLRLNDKTNRLPVIVVSAIANEVKAEINGDAIYVVDWIPKPIDAKRLIEAVTHCVIRKDGPRLPQVLLTNVGPEQEQTISRMLVGTANVVAAPSLAEADAYLNAMEFNLVIVNLNSPTHSELLHLPLLSHRNPPIPIVVISSLDMEDKIISELKGILRNSQYSRQTLIETIGSLISQNSSQTPK